MLLIYRCIISFFFPLIILIIFLRSLFKKEHKLRFKEKLFSSSFNIDRKVSKKLIWFHVASIGELKSIKSLIKKLNSDNQFEFLITTITLSSAQLFDSEFNNQDNITHRFFPLDKKKLINKFLDGWSPNLIIFVDSEIWPNFLLEINKRKIPLVLLNARITKKTFLKWRLIPKSAEKIFKSFDLCLPASLESGNFLNILKAKNIKYIGNLKLSSEIKVKNMNLSNKNFLINNKFWCAVSTHEGEDLFCLKTHIRIKSAYENFFTVIIPRHINRVKNIELLCKNLSLKSQVISDIDTIDLNSEIIIINSYGVIQNYLQFCKSVFIGKSMMKNLEKVGGQSPIEAAKLGCKIYHGSYVYNFKEIYELLNRYKISEQINDEIDLSKKIISDFGNYKKNNSEKILLINNLGNKILNETYNEIAKINNL